MSKQIPLIIFPEKGSWPCHVTPNFFRLPPNISGTAKANNIKLGMLIHSGRLKKTHNYFFLKKGRGPGHVIP